jgi:hypothetical protein
MSSPERQQWLQTPDTLHYRIGEAARSLLTQVHEQTGHRVILREGAPDIHGSYAQIAYATDDEPHTISIIPEATPYLDYLVSHECAHALRFFAQPESERLMAYIDEQHQDRVARTLGPAVKKRFKYLPAPAEELAAIYHKGIIGQVVNFPMDLRIETFLLKQYPELRADQEEVLRLNIAELVLGLHHEVQLVTPPFVFRVQNSLNAAYCTFIARLLNDPTLSQPFRQGGFGRIGAELADQIWRTRYADYRQDRRDTESWAKRFGVERWFTWELYRS